MASQTVRVASNGMGRDLLTIDGAVWLVFVPMVILGLAIWYARI
jgi:hypothetical protein